tara:strand:+ start:179 stop:517 length:339 start_codon:yes stop_codon:yes gene_type:complete
MKFLFDIYKETTDPLNNYNSLVSVKILTAIFIHLIVYFLAYKFLVALTNLPDHSDKVFGALIIIMILGYYFRLARSKSIYKHFISNGFDPKTARLITIKYINMAYFKWYYLA